MTQPIKVAFEAQGKVVPIDAILPTRSVSPLTRKSQKYLRIRASIQEVGIVEPIVVHPQSARGKSAQYLLLDGHLRLDVLREQGATEVLCLISTDDEGFTYNHKVNQISPIQEPSNRTEAGSGKRPAPSTRSRPWAYDSVSTSTPKLQR